MNLVNFQHLLSPSPPFCPTTQPIHAHSKQREHDQSHMELEEE